MTETGDERDLTGYRMCPQKGTSSPCYDVSGRTDTDRICVASWNLASRSIVNSVHLFLGVQQHRALEMSSHPSWGSDEWEKGWVKGGESEKGGGEIPCLFSHSLPEISCLGLLLVKPNRNQLSQETDTIVCRDASPEKGRKEQIYRLKYYHFWVVLILLP